MFIIKGVIWCCLQGLWFMEQDEVEEDIGDHFETKKVKEDAKKGFKNYTGYPSRSEYLLLVTSSSAVFSSFESVYPNSMTVFC